MRNYPEFWDFLNRCIYKINRRWPWNSPRREDVERTQRRRLRFWFRDCLRDGTSSLKLLSFKLIEGGSPSFLRQKKNKRKKEEQLRCKISEIFFPRDESPIRKDENNIAINENRHLLMSSRLERRSPLNFSGTGEISGLAAALAAGNLLRVTAKRERERGASLSSFREEMRINESANAQPRLRDERSYKQNEKGKRG